MARKDLYTAPFTVDHPFANVAAASTDAVVKAGVSGKRIRVLAFMFICGDTKTDANFNSKGSGAGDAISPVFENAANGGAVGPWNPAGWFETDPGEALTLTTGAGSTTGVLVTTVEV